MRMNRISTVVVAASAALVMGMAPSAHATDGDQFVDVTGGHTLAGLCRWYGIASDQGTSAVLHGYAQADATAIGTTIECWLRFANSTTRVPNTTTRQGLPGSTAATSRTIIVPATPTRVCTFAQALFIDGGPPKVYKTPGC